MQPAHVDVGEVDRHAAVADPFGQHLAGTARALDADRVEAAGDEQVAQLGGLAQEVAVVWGEALGPLKKVWMPAVARIGRRAVALSRIGSKWSMSSGRLSKQKAWDAVHAPGLGHRLEGADQELAGVLLVVGALVGDPQHRQVTRHLGQRLGDDVEMLGRVQRHRDADGGQLARPHAGGEHDGRGGDRALLGHHADRPALLDQDADLDALDDAGAALARTLGEGLGGVDRVGLAVLGQEHAADGVADLEQRVAGLDLRGPDHLDREAEVLGHRGAALQLLEALGVERQADRAVLLEPGRLPGLGLQACRSSEVYLASSVIRRVARSCPISPAACQVVPQVSCLRSSSSTSVMPSLVR